MELFSLNRQAFAFLVVIAVTVGLMVLLSPFLLFALGALGVLVLIIVWLKTAIRGRAMIAPFGAAEGALALSALLFVIGGALAGGLIVAQVGSNSFSLFRAMLPFMAGSARPGPPPMARAVQYPDAEDRERLKQILDKEGIPHKTEVRDGKEWIGWSAEHNAAAEAAQQKMREGPFPGGGNSHFPDAKLQNEFTAWLKGKGVKHEVAKNRGEDWVYWEGQQDLVREFMTQRGVDCRKKKPTC